MNYKLFVFDVGNTLISTKDSNIMSSLTLETLNELRKNHYIIGLATLRVIDNIQPILDQFSFDFLILANGALIFCDNNIIYSNPLNNNGLESIINNINDYNVKYKTYNYNKKTYALELFDAPILFQNHNLYTYYWWERTNTLDITALSTSKVSGLKKVLNYYNIDKEEVVAFGDGFNDVDLLEYVGLGIAMGGSPSCLQNKASFVTKSVKEEGITLACKEKSFI